MEDYAIQCLEHYNKTGHVYAMELSTQRVWDYVGDGYVHRLIRNEEDGKFVEMPCYTSAQTTTQKRMAGFFCANNQSRADHVAANVAGYAPAMHRLCSTAHIR